MNWNQLQTILWLRWRITRNQWARSGGLGAVLAAIVAVGVCVLGGVSFLGSFAGAILGLGEAKPIVVMGVWFGLTVAFLFLWLVGLLNELQRSETIDLQRLMHLPVALGQMFIVNYIASHLTFSIILIAPAMLGLALGLAICRNVEMLLLIPLALGMIFMITAWTYYLRGWLATLMSNPRRRRSVIMGITIGFILLVQGPNFYFNVIPRLEKPAAKRVESQQEREAKKTSNHEKFNQLLALQKFIPPLWLSWGAQTLAEGRVRPALLGIAGFFFIGALGLRSAYRSTLKFYHGQSGGKISAEVKSVRGTAAPKTSAQTGRHFLELQLPGVPEQAAALALATFRSMLRAPEVKIAWGTAFFTIIIMGGALFFRTTPQVSEILKPFLATGVMAFSVFLHVQFLANQFGFDRDGFRALVLSPAERRLILIGKNLACLSASGGFGLLLLVLMTVLLHLSPGRFAAALFQLIALLLLATMVGNLLSILVPYRIQPGSMRPTKMPALAMIMIMLCQMLFPLAMSPAFVPPLAEFLWQKAGWPTAVPVNLILSFALAIITGFAYWQTLAPLGRLLQRRETKILGVVTVEVE